MAISLSLLLGIFSSISDLGSLGSYVRSVAGPSSLDKPSFIISRNSATTATINASMVNGTRRQSRPTDTTMQRKFASMPT
ncbi:hypothetical protein WG66_014348 [Moniliophthora roreri]|nr:hypothetical protein WG66_014348 [Moniliophthora roreri]